MNALRTAFTQNVHYNTDQLFLIDQLISFLKEIQRKGCQTKNPLHNLICDFMVLYTPLPNKDHQQFIVFDKKLGAGTFGEVYDSGTFEKIPIITKSSLQFNDFNITEIFVNVVIINSLLMKHHWLQRYLVPTFGIFICSHTYRKTKSKKRLVSICTNKKEYPNIHLVQRKIDGKELYDFIHTTPITLSWVKKILKKIFKVLSFLETSEFNLHHCDLHSRNIMIENKTHYPYIIDFGYASFKVKDKEFYDNKYHGKRIKNASYDIKNIISSFYKVSNSKISDWCKALLFKLFDKLWKSENTPFLKTDLKNFIYKNLYETLLYYESMLTDINERERVHVHNMAILDFNTYSSFKELME